MSCKPSKILFALLCLTFMVTGCSPTKPIYLDDTGDLSYYLEKATGVEYPDIETATLDEVTQTGRPITVIDPDFKSFYDLSLEDCVSIALQNSKVLRGYGTPSLQGTRVLPGQDNLANGPGAAGTVYNVAVRETEPGFIGTPGQIAGPGSITTGTGLDGNQGVEAALADFDAQLTSSMFFTKSNEPRNATPQSPFDPSVFEQDNLQWQTELAKKSANGTQIFFRNVNTWTENNIPLDADGGFQVLDSWYRAAFEVEVRQPLLRGRGAFIQRMPIVISRIGTDQELANLEAQLQNMVTNVEVRYWELYCAYRNLEAAKTGRNAALETVRIVQDRFDEGADVNIQQVAQAKEQYHFFDAQVVDALNNLLSSEGNLRWLLGIASTDCRIIRPIDEAIMAPVEFDWCASLCEALSYRPELRQQRWENKKSELRLAYTKNSLLPELNVTALYRWLGLGNRYGTSGSSLPFPDESSGALNDLYDGNFQELQFGGEYRMPIGFRRELANVRNAQLKLARELARLEDMELDVSRELSEAMRALAANQRIMQSSFNRWKETTVEKEHFDELRDAGVETLDVALDAQRRQAQAEQAFYNALCEYNKVIALIHRRKGTILSYNGICFEEGQWPGKAYIDAQENARRRGASRQLNYGWTRPQVISRGYDGPSNANSGTTSGVGITTTTDAPLYPETMSIDQGIQPFDSGEIIIEGGGGVIAEPYYTPGEVINGAMPGTIQQSTPTLAPPISTPTMGSSSRNVIRDNSVQQASHTEPARRSSRKTRSSSNQKVSAKIKMEQPVRDTARIKAKPLRDARPARTTNQSTAATPRISATTAPGNKVVRPSTMNWEKFGLSNPNSGTQTKAKIKKSEQEESRSSGWDHNSTPTTNEHSHE